MGGVLDIKFSKVHVYCQLLFIREDLLSFDFESINREIEIFALLSLFYNA
jgi:hypothetical protein